MFEVSRLKRVPVFSEGGGKGGKVYTFSKVVGFYCEVSWLGIEEIWFQ